MPEKYVRRDGVPILVRHTGPTTLPQDPPACGAGTPIVCLHDAGLQSSVFDGLLPAVAPVAASVTVALMLTVVLALPWLVTSAEVLTVAELATYCCCQARNKC